MARTKRTSESRLRRGLSKKDLDFTFIGELSKTPRREIAMAIGFRWFLILPSQNGCKVVGMLTNDLCYRSQANLLNYLKSASIVTPLCTSPA